MKSSIQTSQIKLHSLEQIERNFKAPSSEAVKEAYAGTGLLGGGKGASGSGLLGGGGRGASGSGLLGGRQGASGSGLLGGGRAGA